jgi:hypothetical protein
MAGSRGPLFADSMKRRADVRQRAAEARAYTKVTSAWDAHIKAAAKGTVWRVSAAWVEQACGSRCADLTHVSTGKVRTIRLAADEAIEACRAALFTE